MLSMVQGLALAALPASAVWVYILRGPRAILRVGRSKSGYRKLMKSMSFKDKLFMRNFVKLSNTAKGLQRYFVIMTLVFYLSVVALIVLVIIRIMFPSVSFRESFAYYSLFKAFFEVPGIIVFSFSIYYERVDGGRLDWEWKFKRDYKGERSGK